MDIVTLADAPDYDRERVVTQPFIECSQSNVRVIRLSPGQACLRTWHARPRQYAVEGGGMLTTEDGTVEFLAGSLAHHLGDDELRLANEGTTGLTLLALPRSPASRPVPRGRREPVDGPVKTFGPNSSRRAAPSS